MDLDSHPFTGAVRFFWQRRQGQAAEQAARGSFDQGTRSAVTGGNHMNGFVMSLVEALTAAAVPLQDIVTRRSRTHLPGYFRSSKQWDLVVFRRGQVLAAVELKSQVGSFGNNFNNRTEEALGNSNDLWTAFREGILGSTEPFVGFLYLIESHPNSLSPVQTYSPNLPVLDEFEGASYRDRLGILCRKMMLERKYSSTCAIEASAKDAESVPNYLEIPGSHPSTVFIDRLVKRVSEHY